MTKHSTPISNMITTYHSRAKLNHNFEQLASPYKLS